MWGWSDCSGTPGLTNSDPPCLPGGGSLEILARAARAVDTDTSVIVSVDLVVSATVLATLETAVAVWVALIVVLITSSSLDLQ